MRSGGDLLSLRVYHNHILVPGTLVDVPHQFGVLQPRNLLSATISIFQITAIARSTRL